jgi:hypothetical protein
MDITEVHMTEVVAIAPDQRSLELKNQRLTGRILKTQGAKF